MLVVDAEAAHGRVGGIVIEMRGIDLRDLAPRREFLWSDVVPLVAAVARPPDQAIVCAGPECVDVFERRRERVNYTTLLFRIFRNEIAYAGWNSGILAREIIADGLPGISAVGCF